MSTAMTVGTCGAPRITEWRGGLLPSDPFTSVRYHYGMLLGEEDFVTDQAYHRGKQRLHAAAFHGGGVRWGFDVSLVALEGAPVGDLQVEPGLALDPLGQELYIDRPWCADVTQWFVTHRDDDDLEVRENDDGVAFDAHVVLCFRACLSRPVPALVDSCDTGSTDVECSRIQETVRLELRPGRAPERPPRAGHLMRVFFGLDAVRPEYDGARQENAAVQAQQMRQDIAGEADPHVRGDLIDAACRRLAALDTVLWGWGGEGPLPAIEGPCLALADVTDIRLSPDGDEGWTLVSADVDVGVRAALLPTDALQELLCGCGCGRASAAAGAAPEPRPLVATVADAGGPRVESSEVRFAGKRITLPFTGRPLKGSVEEPGAVLVESFNASSGWTALAIDGFVITPRAGGADVRIDLVDPPPDGALRIVARGTGARPVLAKKGGDFLPLAGAVGDAPAGPSEGRDFVHMITVRS